MYKIIACASEPSGPAIKRQKVEPSLENILVAITIIKDTPSHQLLERIEEFKRDIDICLLTGSEDALELALSLANKIYEPGCKGYGYYSYTNGSYDGRKAVSYTYQKYNALKRIMTAAINENNVDIMRAVLGVARYTYDLTELEDMVLGGCQLLTAKKAGVQNISLKRLFSVSLQQISDIDSLRIG
ncbi:hypothetical protein HOC37_07055 [bacterium]|nr:hypothetical protein [bacterium]MBT3581898.1 hypothetical protein [bacterium]MBT4552716.1 hypothetical protein [bacterium]MBT5989040.1 hypothetical protein [bacterium]MBT7087362.1 hypothetical protein [bacterium]